MKNIFKFDLILQWNKHGKMFKISIIYWGSIIVLKIKTVKKREKGLIIGFMVWLRSNQWCHKEFYNFKNK